MRLFAPFVAASTGLLLVACGGGSGGGGGGGGPPAPVPSGLFVPASSPASWTGNDVRAMFTRDQDQDGILDLLAIDLTGDAVFARRGLGDGHFEPPVGLQTFIDPNAMLLVDLDGDGVPEALALDYPSATLRVGDGNADGTFEDPVPYVIDVQSESMAAGDLDGDLDPDVVAGSEKGVALLLGDAGTALVVSPAISTESEYYVALGDVDEDGHLDMLSRGPGALRRRLGNGDGTFGAFFDFPTPDIRVNGPIALGDLNGDGHLDAVACRGITDEMGVSLGDGDGGFTPAPTVVVGNTTQFAYLGTLAHLNGDAHLDLLVTREDAGEVHVLHGVGDGTFTPAQVLPVGPQARALLVADLNGDGLQDLLVSCISGGGTTYAYLGTSL